ncbi:hypothetical protein INH39_31370 [Massilia violaceinigra]|uniref:Uncharacterized protein n=1 Tax=Massilia violaceinigra TaxID=2045208 RepID=A0ABY4A6Q2_9BURK|nr:hypothetical protein [Massilia violaceinigra]UOD29820.1 hypothetical protein INH39_31370 [Massilia violaceinigra]
MTKSTPQQGAALNILDWLHFNQALVYAVVGDDDVSWLFSIVERVKAAVAATGKTGVEAEIMKHYVLCYLEIGAADENISDYPDAAVCEQVLGCNQRYFTAMLRARAHAATGYCSNAEMAIAGQLCADVKAAPVAVRFRLTERCLALEYPNAARDALLWFAATNALPCAKYSKDNRKRDTTVLARIGLLCEFELMRQSVRGGRKAKGVGQILFENIAAAIPSPFDRKLVEQAGALWLEKFYGTEPISNAWLPFLVDRAFDAEYVGLFLDNVSTRWQRRRLCEGTAAAWAGIIGAFNLVVARLNDDATPLYASKNDNAGTLSDAASKSLFRHGLTIRARTLYAHYDQFERSIRPRIADYYANLQSCGSVIPADDEDIWYVMLCVGCL